MANNASWCAAMCHAHGLADHTTERVWASTVRTPLFYPDAITLRPGCTADEVLARVDLDTAGASVKDSFADLDLSDHGFEVLFDAQWITFERADEDARTVDTWRVVDNGAGRHRWAHAWDAEHADLFRPALLADDTTTLIADGTVTAGAELTGAAGVVGVSNLFGPDGGASPWPGVLDTAERLFPAVPVVGYESGDDLAAAIRYGAQPIGPLRVWLAT